MKIRSIKRVYFAQVVLLVLLALNFREFLYGDFEVISVLLIIMFFLLVSGMYLYGGLILVGRIFIEYKCCYFLERRISTDDIKGWKVLTGEFNGDGFKPTFRLEVYSKSGQKPLIIPIKIFRDEDIKLLTDWIDKEIGVSSNQ